MCSVDAPCGSFGAQAKPGNIRSARDQAQGCIARQLQRLCDQLWPDNDAPGIGTVTSQRGQLIARQFDLFLGLGQFNFGSRHC